MSRSFIPDFPLVLIFLCPGLGILHMEVSSVQGSPELGIPPITKYFKMKQVSPEIHSTPFAK
jgi:hypothetical protein